MGTLLFISGIETVVIVLVVLLLFGAKSIPDVARMLGKGMNEFRRASEEIKREFRENTSGITDVVEETKQDLNREIESLDRPDDKAIASSDHQKTEDQADDEADREVPPTSSNKRVSRNDAVD
ncbi:MULTISPECIES: twin-arginine translocase TatA/TatE family subunit [unclassified Carboxylicivirga]|uniref:twin-arginine translocase TatA/TatE family subunit n=1 Tax=Carboxylicivirga TaxID=1628153 RepID=UPI003D32AD40